MRIIFPIVFLIFSSVLSSTVLQAQSPAVIKLTKGYMEDVRPSGYIIHSHSGETINYHLFSYKEMEEEHIIRINKETIDNTALTIFDCKIGESAWIHTSYTLYDGLLVVTSPTYFPCFSPDCQLFKYKADFSKYSDADQISKIILDLQERPSSLDKNQLYFRYLRYHPLLIPFEKNGNKNEMFFYANTMVPQEEVYRQKFKIKNKHVFSTKDFANFPLASSKEWYCQMLLYSRDTELPYLMNTISYDKNHISIPLPEKLNLDKIGLNSRCKNEEHYCLLYPPFIENTNELLAPEPRKEMESQLIDMKERVINLDSTDASYFTLLLEFEWEDTSSKDNYWSASGRVDNNTRVRLPDLPEEILRRRQF